MRGLDLAPLLFFIGVLSAQIPPRDPSCYAFWDSKPPVGSVPTRTYTVTSTKVIPKLHCTGGVTTKTPTGTVWKTTYVHVSVSGYETVSFPATVTETESITKYAATATTTSTRTIVETFTPKPSSVTVIPTPQSFLPIARADSRFLTGTAASSGSYAVSVSCEVTKTTTVTSTSICNIYTTTAPRVYVTRTSTSTDYYGKTVIFTHTLPGITTQKTVRGPTVKGTTTSTAIRWATTTVTITSPTATEYAMCNDPANYASHFRYNSSKILPFFSASEKDSSSFIGVADIELYSVVADSAKECCERCAAEKDNCSGSVFTYANEHGFWPYNFCTLFTSGDSCRAGETQWYGAVSEDYQAVKYEGYRYVLMNGPCGRGGATLRRPKGCGDRCEDELPTCIYDYVNDCDPGVKRRAL